MEKEYKGAILYKYRTEIGNSLLRSPLFCIYSKPFQRWKRLAIVGVPIVKPKLTIVFSFGVIFVMK